ncbi:MAG: Hint domain-containing protein, partial [Acetobacteraceae bacterium]
MVDADADGTIQIDVAGTIADATLTASISVVILDNGLLEATVGHSLTANGDIAGTGSLLVAGTMGLNGTVAPGLQLGFDPGTLILGSPLTMQATIENFTDGDSIRFAGTYASLTNTFSGGVLTAFGDGTPIASLTFAGAYTPADFSLSQSGGFVTVNTDVPCFGAGTRILTTRGEIAVEALRVGDLAITRDGTERSIIWVGHRHIDVTRHPRPDNALPYRIRRDAFADGKPARDVLLSPDHAVFIDGSLIPVKCLDNGRTIAQARVEAIDYYHVELAGHDILLAEGLPVESYLDTGNRAMFANAGVAMLLHPEFAITSGIRYWASDACAELVTHGPVLLAARRALAARADALGYHADTQPGLRLFAGGRAIAPCAA